jgi:NitT/TauT family transport system permease protein
MKAPRLLWALPVPLVLLGLWSIAVQREWLTLIPPPLEVLTQVLDFAVGGFRDDAYTGSLLSHLLASIGRVIAGFGLATLTAVPLGILLGRSDRLSALLEPTLGLLRPIPVTAWVPLVLIVFGLGARSAIILIFIGSFYPVLLNTVAGVKRVPPRLVEAAAMLGTSPRAMLYKVVLPAAAPSIFAGVRIALGLAWVVVVVGETVGVPTGLGAVITEAREVSRTEVIITGMIFIGLAGLASDKLLTWGVERTLGTRFATAH